MPLPKHIIKKYGVTKKAWQIYRGNKTVNKKSVKNRSMGKKRTYAKRKITSGLPTIYKKAEKSIGASRIVERLMNISGVVPEPYASVVSSGVGFARGGIIGGVSAVLFSSDIPEMVIGRAFGNDEGLNNGSQVNGL
jgi:hypothetical protein